VKLPAVCLAIAFPDGVALGLFSPLRNYSLSLVLVRIIVLLALCLLGLGFSFLRKTSFLRQAVRLLERGSLSTFSPPGWPHSLRLPIKS